MAAMSIWFRVICANRSCVWLVQSRQLSDGSRVVVVVWDGNYNGLRSMWSREDEEWGEDAAAAPPPSPPGSGSAGQSSKGQKVKIWAVGILFSFPKQTVINPSVMAVSAPAAVSPGLLVTSWREAMSLQHQPHLRRHQRTVIIFEHAALKVPKHTKHSSKLHFIHGHTGKTDSLIASDLKGSI